MVVLVSSSHPIFVSERQAADDAGLGRVQIFIVTYAIIDSSKQDSETHFLSLAFSEIHLHDRKRLLGDQMFKTLIDQNIYLHR